MYPAADHREHDDFHELRLRPTRLRLRCAIGAIAVCVDLCSYAATGDLSGGLTLSSQLVDRGQALTDATPIVQGNVAWTSPDGWALSISGSARIDAPGDRFIEATLQAARYWSLSPDWSMQASVFYYKYPARKSIYDRAETGLHWTYRDTLTFGLSATSALHDSGYRLREAADATLRWPLDEHVSLSAGVGVARSFAMPYRPYRYGQVGLAWIQGRWRLDVFRVASDQKREFSRAYPTLEPWAATVQWSF